MYFQSELIKELESIQTHPGRVARKEASMEGMVPPDFMGRHCSFIPFLNPQMHERRPSPLRFHRQMEFYQSAYRGSTFACYLWSIMDFSSRVATRYLFMPLKSPSRSTPLRNFIDSSRAG